MFLKQQHQQKSRFKKQADNLVREFGSLEVSESAKEDTEQAAGSSNPAKT